MGQVYPEIDERLRSFLLAAPVFFVATAPSGARGHVNVSPKGGTGTLAVLDPRSVAYLDFTGSGAETIAHLRENGRIVVMCCAFSGAPRIVRLHGRGEVVLPGHAEFPSLLAHFSAATQPGIRGVVRIRCERISDSCGYGVPLMDYRGERTAMPAWAAHQGTDGLAAYRLRHNQVSIDGLPAIPPPASHPGGPALSGPGGPPTVPSDDPGRLPP